MPRRESDNTLIWPNDRQCAIEVVTWLVTFSIDLSKHAASKFYGSCNGSRGKDRNIAPVIRRAAILEAGRLAIVAADGWRWSPWIVHQKIALCSPRF
jgi:hypothetical protein